jgi:hypothetical protein
MRYFAEDIEDYTTLLNNLYACEEGWINFNEVINIFCSQIKKDRDHLVHEFDRAISQRRLWGDSGYN